MNEPVLLPVFPLHTVLLPGMMLPPRIFEQRYLQMDTMTVRLILGRRRGYWTSGQHQPGIN